MKTECSPYHRRLGFERVYLPLRKVADTKDTDLPVYYQHCAKKASIRLLKIEWSIDCFWCNCRSKQNESYQLYFSEYMPNIGYTDAYFYFVIYAYMKLSVRLWTSQLFWGVQIRFYWDYFLCDCIATTQDLISQTRWRCWLQAIIPCNLPYHLKR